MKGRRSCFFFELANFKGGGVRIFRDADFDELWGACRKDSTKRNLRCLRGGNQESGKRQIHRTEREHEFEPARSSQRSRSGEGRPALRAAARPRLARGAEVLARSHWGYAEAAAAFVRLQMAERDGQSISRIGGFGNFGHRQERANHCLHLALVGVAVTGDGSFDFARRVRENFDLVL